MNRLILSFTSILIFLTNIFGQCLESESEYKKYFKTNIQNLDPIEGIWSPSYKTTCYDKYMRMIDSDLDKHIGQLAIIKKEDFFVVCSDLLLEQDDFSGIIIMYLGSGLSFYKTAIDGIYIHKRRDSDKDKPSIKADVTLTGDKLFEYKYIATGEEMGLLFFNGKVYIPYPYVEVEARWIKLYPTEMEYKSNKPSSGTGFAISSDGYIVTNYHIVENAKKIKVKGINSNFSKSYSAKIIISDKNNDLAIIKLDDFSFSGLEGSLPYIIKKSISEVGENTFVLGYPLTATMGEEIKLTNGIISSKSGFQGDITSYQITAPIQPGNSGAPIFDNYGNLIGVVNAKHIGAENAGYAVKSKYLINLINELPTIPKLQTISSVKGKTLSEQVKLIKKFVYIIEIN